MPDETQSGQRKRLRVGHVSERGGINAVRTLLEAHGMVVDEVDGRSDYGRDLNVDITEDGQVTGAVIGVQVKGDRRFIRDDDWELPAAPKDRRYWAESSVPIVGILWDPVSHEMRWTNLTAYAQTDRTISTWPPRSSGLPPAEDLVVRFSASRRLDDDTLPELAEQMLAYVRQTSSRAFLGLFDPDDERRCEAVFDCWTLGRSDARAFHLLRRALPSLAGESLRQAIGTLSHLTPHPDIFWHEGNWVPPEIERQVLPTFRWSAQEVCDLVRAVEYLTKDGDAGWERGGLGQCLWCLLIEDPDLRSTILPAIGLALNVEDLEAAFRLLVIHQYLADDPLVAAREAIALHPGVGEHAYTHELLQQIAEFGFINVY
jgi:hypothetical protein